MLLNRVCTTSAKNKRCSISLCSDHRYIIFKYIFHGSFSSYVCSVTRGDRSSWLWLHSRYLRGNQPCWRLRTPLSSHQQWVDNITGFVLQHWDPLQSPVHVGAMSYHWATFAVPLTFLVKMWMVTTSRAQNLLHVRACACVCAPVCMTAHTHFCGNLRHLAW